MAPPLLPRSVRLGAALVCALYVLGALAVLFGPASGAPVDGTNLTPFHTIGRQLDRGLHGQLIGNTLLLAPIGFTLRLWGWSIGRVLLAVTAGAVAIEAGQALVGRVSDIDDVILNVLGALIGVLVASVVAAVWSRSAPSAQRSTGESTTESVLS